MSAIEHEPNPYGSYYGHVNEIAGQKERKMEWIKVEDQIPDEGQDVLLFCYDQIIVGHCSIKRDGRVDFWSMHGDKLYPAPTHWMPLPEPPKQEK